MTSERIPPLLRKRIEALKGTKYELSDEAFRRATSAQAVFDRILVWQVPETWYGGDTFAGTTIEKSAATQKRHAQNTPRGLVISIGLAAMDAMRSNGIGLGHFVHFQHNAPYRRPLDDHDQQHLIALRAGDIVSSEDLADALDSGVCQAVWNPESRCHVFVDHHGESWAPSLPWMED